MNTWKQKSQLAQADLTSEASANLARERSPAVQYLQEAAAGEQSHPLELDKQMRSRMERQFGLDFSSVRLVESDLPGKLGADAVAQGDLIRFAPGAFHPETAQGEQLLSHELSHVVQQSRAMISDDAVGMPLYDAGMESGADTMAARALDGGLTAGTVRSFTPISTDQAPMQGNKLFYGLRQDLAALFGGQNPRVANESEVQRVRKNRKPFGLIKRAMENTYTGRSSPLQDPNMSFIFQPLEDVPEGQLGYNQDNPTGNAYLEAMDRDIDRAGNLEELEIIFRKYTCDSSLPKLENEGKKGVKPFAESNLALGEMKAQLKQMGRVMLAFPGLGLGELGMDTTASIFKPSDVANAYFYSGDLNFQNFAFREGLGMDFARGVFDSLIQLITNDASSTKRHVGVHELGHVINGHMAKRELQAESPTLEVPKESDKVEARARKIATSIITTALRKLHNTNGSPVLDRELLYKLYKSGLISRYGSTSVTEMLAEALADVCNKGKGASPVNLAIVKEMESQYRATEQYFYLVAQSRKNASANK